MQLQTLPLCERETEGLHDIFFLLKHFLVYSGAKCLFCLPQAQHRGISPKTAVSTSVAQTMSQFMRHALKKVKRSNKQQQQKKPNVSDWMCR